MTPASVESGKRGCDVASGPTYGLVHPSLTDLYLICLIVPAYWTPFYMIFWILP
jgi:hypothetical protein